MKRLWIRFTMSKNTSLFNPLPLCERVRGFGGYGAARVKAGGRLPWRDH
jgi:hypothetical protein